MLANARDYKEELESKMRATWGNKKYWYYHNCSYFRPVVVEEDTWNKTQFVSLDASGNVAGYLAYGVEREGRYVTYLEIINFMDDRGFGLDVMRMVKDIFEKYRYRKIVFSVIIGNPIEPKYDRLVLRYGGRIVGTYKEHAMLPNGIMYDEKFYEIRRVDYLVHKKRR